MKLLERATDRGDGTENVSHRLDTRLLTDRPRASHGIELLDDPEAEPRVVEESLRHIARSNRWFGGWWAVQSGLTRVLAQVPRGSRLTLLDIGTGAGDLPVAAARWAAARGLQLAPLGLERHRTAANLARGAGLPTVLACAGTLPMRSRSVDVVLMSQLAHHLSAAAVVGLLTELDRIARVGVVVADLRRSALALAAFWCGSRLLRFDRVTRSDGMTSIRRGYRTAELRSLLARAGIDARVDRTPGFRLVASWRTGVGS